MASNFYLPQQVEHSMNRCTPLVMLAALTLIPSNASAHKASSAPALAVGAPAPSWQLPADACCTHGSESTFYVTAEALFWKPDPARRQPIVINQNTLDVILTSRAAGFDAEPLPRLTVGFALSGRSAFEATYFGRDDWSAADDVDGNNDLALAGDLALATDDFFGADKMRLTYAFEIHNGELNYIRRLGDSNVELIAGARYVYLRERFNIHTTDSDAEQSDYRIGTENNLFGGQLGARAQWRFGFLALETVVKAGLFGNDAKQHTFLSDFNNTFNLRNSRTDGGDAAFVGEIGVNAIVQLTRSMSARAGYNLMWITGVARAPDQLDFADTATSGTALHAQGDVFLHGASVGIEFRW
jgi:putative beta barrel porin BBP7